MRLSSTVVTVYASLGEDALVHSLNEVSGDHHHPLTALVPSAFPFAAS